METTHKNDRFNRQIIRPHMPASWSPGVPQSPSVSPGDPQGPATPSIFRTLLSFRLSHLYGISQQTQKNNGALYKHNPEQHGSSQNMLCIGQLETQCRPEPLSVKSPIYPVCKDPRNNMKKHHYDMLNCTSYRFTIHHLYCLRALRAFVTHIR